MGRDTGTYDFNKVATAMGTDEAMLVAVPFLAAEMAVDQFPLAGRVVCYRRHSLGEVPAGAGKGRGRRRKRRKSAHQAERVKEVVVKWGWGGGGVCETEERGCG